MQYLYAVSIYADLFDFGNTPNAPTGTAAVHPVPRGRLDAIRQAVQQVSFVTATAVAHDRAVEVAPILEAAVRALGANYADFHALPPVASRPGDTAWVASSHHHVPFGYMHDGQLKYPYAEDSGIYTQLAVAVTAARIQVGP